MNKYYGILGYRVLSRDLVSSKSGFNGDKKVRGKDWAAPGPELSSRPPKNGK